MKSTPTTLLGPLIEALLQPDYAMAAELSLAETAGVTVARLADQKTSLAAALASSSIGADAFAGAQPQRITQMEKLADAVLAAGGVAQPASHLSGWFGVLQKIAAQSSAISTAPFIEAAMHAASAQLGDQRYLRIIEAHDELQDTLRAYQLQNRMAGQAQPAAQEIVKAAAHAGGGASGPWRLVNWVGLEECLTQFFEQWTAQPARDETRASVAFVRGIQTQLVAQLDLPHALWEYLLIKVDAYLSRLAPRASHSFVSQLIQPLAAGVNQFGVLGDMLRRSAPLPDQAPSAHSHICELIGLQMTMNMHPDCRLSALWQQKLNIANLRRTGLTADSVGACAKKLVESMRGERERHELDQISQAAADIQQWLSAVDAADKLSTETQGMLDQLASQLIEGAADTDGKARVSTQLHALIRQSVYAQAIAPTPLQARTLLRRAIALNLNVSRDLQVWKRHKQIAARLGQLEVASAGLESYAAAVGALSGELEKIIADQVRLSTRWLKLPDTASTPSAHEIGCHPEELQVVAARFSAYRKLYGPQGANAAMTRWYCAFLFSVPRRVDWKAMVQALHNALEVQPALVGCEDLRDGLLDWLRCVPLCAAARNVCLEADAMVDICIRFGLARYEERVAQGLAPELQGGVRKAWELGRIDCAWTLGRLSCVVSQGDVKPADGMWFWWQLGVGKNIARVPEAFIKAYLQSLSEALHETMTSEEAAAVFGCVFSCYQRMFGLRQKEGNAELKLFAPLLAEGAIWQSLLGHGEVNQPLVVYATLLGKACPPAIHTLGQSVLDSMGQMGDEEVLWQRQMPVMLGMIENLGADAVEQALTSWQINGTDHLPLGAGALWHSLLQRARQVLRQVAMGQHVMRHGGALATLMASNCPEVNTAYKGKGSVQDALKRFLARMAMTWLSEPPSLVAVNLARYFMFMQATELPLGKAGWRTLWAMLEAALQRSSQAPVAMAAIGAMAQCMVTTDEMELAQSVSGSLFAQEELGLAETQTEELRWRMAVSSLMATACIPDHAPCSGKAALCRAFTACDVFADETAASWAMRSQALNDMVKPLMAEAFKTRLSERMAQLGNLVFEKNRLLELPSVSTSFRYCVLMSGLPSAMLVWRSHLFARQVDERKAILSAEDAFVGSLLREPAPDPLRVGAVRQELTAAMRFRNPDHVEYKRLIGRERKALTDVQAQALTLLGRSLAAQEFMDRYEYLGQLRDTVRCFALPAQGAAGDQAGLLSHWLVAYTDQKTPGGNQASLKNDMGNVLAGWRLNQPRKQPPPAGHHAVSKAANEPPPLQIKEPARLYLVAVLQHSLRRPAGMSAYLFLLEEVLRAEWRQVAGRLGQLIKSLDDIKDGPVGSDAQAWGTEPVPETVVSK